MLSCAGADRLQTGMRGAFGKPYGLVARVSIGQIIMSVRSQDKNLAHLVEGFRRAKFKFPGRQKVVVSNQWGFTGIPKPEYLKLKEEGKVRPDGVTCKVIRPKGLIGHYQ